MPQPIDHQNKKKAITAYFYHTQDIQFILGKYAQGEFPSHFLYGALHLENEGINVVWHKSISNTKPRWHRMLHTAWRILLAYRHIDVVYATHYVGLELIVFLRALGLFRKPIVVWHHQPVVIPQNNFRDSLGRFFYKGLDRMIFFSQKLINDSIATRKVPTEKLVLGHWGPDLDFYDRLMSENAVRSGFISTGKELRDFSTLTEAFERTGAPLEVYTYSKFGKYDYENTIKSKSTKGNINTHFMTALAPADLARKVNQASCIVVCCMETKYTVGLTTVVEALALGLPTLCSRNPQIPFDFEKDGIGISIPYNDVDGWEQAINYITTHPDEALRMGRKARLLAETRYNDRLNAKEVADVLRSVLV